MANYKELFEEQKHLNEQNERKIQELEKMQEIIENTFRNLTLLKNELTHVNESAQHEDAHIQSFLCAFLPEFKFSTPAAVPSNCTSLSPEPPPLEEIKMPQVQIQFKMENSLEQTIKLPIPTVSYEWSDSSPMRNSSFPSYLPRRGYSSYLSSRSNLNRVKPSEELKLTLKFGTISSDLPAKIHLELCDEEGNVVFKKRQNIYYVKLQEKLCTLDSDHDYILKVTSIQDDVKTDEEVLIQNKQACDGKVQVAKPKEKPIELILHSAQTEELPKHLFKPEVTFAIEPLESWLPPDFQESPDYRSCTESDPFCLAKRTKKPVILHNKEDPPKVPEVPKKMIVFEQKKVLPDVALFKWHKGFRNCQGKYKRVKILKLEVYYPDDLHDLRVTRDLSLVLTCANMSSTTRGRVRDHKCLAEFVIFEDFNENSQFCINVNSLLEASDLLDFSIEVGTFCPDKWMKKEFKQQK